MKAGGIKARQGKSMIMHCTGVMYILNSSAFLQGTITAATTQRVIDMWMGVIRNDKKRRVRRHRKIKG